MAYFSSGALGVTNPSGRDEGCALPSHIGIYARVGLVGGDELHL